ncbi:hypothetical protein AJ79_03764 [Helicocarpus griseus UAMH5409]|uniref:Uncharacterized protein n=1 Tax=Helicocarpus griseus UAMH5409 TaxID=1447875 RepID=A0A2B7XXJ9_9EURO|nr:hypothetical protein AJ79_03764 [Helicocarpus griseus UAMH5409]
MYGISDQAKACWHKSPPCSPYSIPAIAVYRDDVSSESHCPGHKRGYTQTKKSGIKTSVSSAQFDGCGDKSSMSDGTSETTEDFPEFLEIKNSQFVGYARPVLAPSVAQVASSHRAGGHHYYSPPQVPPQSVAGRPIHPQDDKENYPRGYQAGYSCKPEPSSFVPRCPLQAMSTNVRTHSPMQNMGFGNGKNGQFNLNSKRAQFTNTPPMVGRVGSPQTFLSTYPMAQGIQYGLNTTGESQFANPPRASPSGYKSAVNTNLVVGGNRFVGVPQTMGQTRASSVTPVMSKELEVLSSSPSPQPPSNYNNNNHNINNTLQLHLKPPMATTMPAADCYASDTACYSYAMPFDHGARDSLPPKFGVIKITNIPYSVTKHEILQFLGRNARPLTPDMGCPVHIIMERSTGKTMDCYVEFPTKADADNTLNWINRCLDTFQTPKLGNRHVVVRASSQDELLKDLFPRAKNVDWRDGIPYVRSKKEKFCSGFQGFLTGEEIFCTVRHAEVPHRSPYCAKCLQRPYENMTSTLYKFPWYATMHYTVEDRNQLFSATLRLLHALVPQVERGKTIGLDSRLVGELLEAGLRCPVFNERQKFVLNIAAKNYGAATTTSPTARFWPFDALTRKHNATEDHVLQYAELIAAGAASKDPGTDTLRNTWHPVMHAGSPFGNLWLEWGWGNTNIKWQIAVDYEHKILLDLVTEGVKVKRGEESPYHSHSSSTSSASIAPEGYSDAIVGPTTSGNGHSASNPIYRYPVRANHNPNRHGSSAPTNLLPGQSSSNGLSYGNDAVLASQPNPTQRTSSNSFSAGTDTSMNVPRNIFGAVGTRRRSRAATNASRHSPVPEVDEDCYNERSA